MSAKILVAVTTLCLAPMTAFAQSSDCEKAHANCKAGTTYDEKTKACVVVSS